MKKISMAVVLAVGLAACENIPTGYTNQGVAIGAVSGAVIGATAYSGNRSRGAIIGAIGGGLAGGAVGAYMDNQKRDLEKNLAKEIQTGEAKVEKMPNDVVRITMTSHTAFDTNSTAVKPSFYSTHGQARGRGDAVQQDHPHGRRPHRQRRDGQVQPGPVAAPRVLGRAVLRVQARERVRLATAGKGEKEPVASNANEAGRQLNRRVEIYVEPVREG